MFALFLPQDSYLGSLISSDSILATLWPECDFALIRLYRMDLCLVNVMMFVVEAQLEK